VRNMLLTRLLVPEAFGAMAIVLSSSSLIASLSDVGMWPAIVSHPRGGEDEYLNAAWWMGLARALCLYIFIFLFAPTIAHFYGTAGLSPLLRFTLVSTILDGLLSPRSKLAQKDLKFGRLAFINNGGAMCGVILTILLGLWLRNVWALAIGFCSENAFRCTFSYILYPSLPSLRWDRHALRELVKFSRGMFGLSFLNLVFARTDIFILGKLYSPALLGFYSLAVNLVQTPSSFLINMMSSILLPVFARVQTDKRGEQSVLLSATSWNILLGLPIVATISLSGSSILRIVYGPRYSAAAAALSVGAAVALLNVLNSIITAWFFATGRPELHRRAVAASAITMAAICYPACHVLGLVGGQAAALIAILVSYGLQIQRVRQISGLKTRPYGRPVVLAGIVSGGVLAVGYAFRHLGLEISPVANISLAALACVLAYSAYVPLLGKQRYLASGDNEI
jgi:lipopolysaccharide exporter